MPAARAQRTPMSSAAPPAAPAPVIAAPAPVVVQQVATTEPTELPVRPARKPFGERRQRLDNTPIPGFQCYWINDLPGRIDQAKQAGYEHVKGPDGNPVKLVVGVMEGGGALTAYRMKIPRQWYEEDQQAKEGPRREIDAQMRQGNKDGGYASAGRPGYTESTVTATMNAEGRQTFSPK